MIIFEDKRFQTRSDKPNEDWTDEALYVVEDGTELANRIQSLYPYYDFVLDSNNKLIDVIEVEKLQITMSQQEKREQAYETMTEKEDGTILIEWEEQAITVDTANKKWLNYSAEGNLKANELSALIVNAKAYIRELYLDE